MTLSSGADAEDKIPQAGTALVPTDDFSGIAPFTAMAAEETPRPRGLRALLLDYSAHVAMIVGLIGFAWTVSDHVVNRPAAPPVEKTRVSQLETKPLETKLLETKAVGPKPDDSKAFDPKAFDPKAFDPKAIDPMAELRQTNAAMAQDIKALRTNLETLRASMHQDRAPEQMRALTANLDSMKSGLAAAKAETSAAVAQLSGKLDKLQREAALKEVPGKETSGKIAEVEHAPKVERQAIDTDATGSLPASNKPTPVPPVRPQQAKLAQMDDGGKSTDEPGKAQPQILAAYVVRDVYEGVALIEGKRGSLEVVPGVSIPGAGVVKSIDRHGNGWTVTTTKGVLAYAAQTRETRRSARDYYQPSYRYDF